MKPEIDLYLRKSKVVRTTDARDLLSVVSQEERGRAWAHRNGYTVRKVWVDNLSAWSDVTRPEHDKALDAVLNGEIGALWCAFLDRFTRKGVEGIIPILGKARVIFDYEGLDSANERDRRWIIDRAEQAREFSLRLSYNVRSTKASQRDRGKWLGAAPYGFEINDRTARKLVHSEDWPIVMRIVQSLAGGMSLRTLCRELNADKIPSPNGGQWRVSTATRFLHNPVYEGWQTTGKREYRDASGERVSVLAEGTSPVPHDLLVRARAVASGVFAAADRTSTRHLLTGISFCAGCGRALPCTGRSYVCATHISGGECEAPASVMRTSLESYVRDRWVSRLSAADDDDPLLPAVAARYTALREPKTAEGYQDALAALKAAQTGVQRLADQMAQGLYDPPFDTQLPRLQREARAALESATERVAELTPVAIDITFLRDSETSEAVWEGADPSLRRDLVRAAVRRITVRKASARGERFDGNQRVEIEWHEE